MSHLKAIDVRLRDNSVAVVVPVHPTTKICEELLEFLHQLFNDEIERGQTWPIEEKLTRDEFKEAWTKHFCAVLLQGTSRDLMDPSSPTRTLGTFYIKPNYVGRCSHVCNAGFLVTPNARGKGVGREMGRVFLTYAPLLGYEYSVFNLVFETNVASQRIWDSLGFERIGLIKGAGRLKGIPERVDAIMYGKQLTIPQEVCVNGSMPQ